MRLKGAEIVVECLIELGTDIVFGYPGGAVIPIYDALYDRQDRIQHVLTAHEQGASHAADGYARVTKKTGVCIATSGPGATNLVTGIATAYMDSTPLVAITGNVSTDLLGRDSFQEVDIMGITMPVTKHNYQVTNAEDIAKTIREAFIISKTGRPGPVLIDITKDALMNECEFDTTFSEERLHELQAAIGIDKQNPLIAKEINESVDYAIQLIEQAEKPAIYAGGGVITSGAKEELLEFAERIQAPVSCSLMGVSAFPHDHELYAGMVGMHGSKTSNMAFTECDLLVVLGARFSDRVTGKVNVFARGAKVLHIDIDQAEVNKNISAYHHIIDDVKSVLGEFNKKLVKQGHSEWLHKLNKWKKEDRALLEGKHAPREMISKMRELFEEDAVIVTDVGQHQMWTAQYYKFRKNDTFVTSGGLGTMGFGLGATIGSQFGSKGQRVILITGDGSFRMNLNEMATAIRYNLSIIIVLMDNNALGMVRQWQDLFYNRRFSETTLPEVDFTAVAKAFGLDAYRLDCCDDFEEIFKKALKSDKPVLIHCKINHDTMVLPMVPPGKAIDNIMMKKAQI
ncbi:MAG TPA: biosynthetic-type acetolactate synthase large subunit [Clostridiales bacterium]|nr:biosynthetic-type acetolactate synthase large subunit [Clostridiales bacterium]